MPPQTDYEWTIHSINIHGVFFERWCQKTVADSGPWKVASTSYPVQFAGKESTLDIRAEYRATTEHILTLPIECKKNNPDFVDWIFFPKNAPSQAEAGYVPDHIYVAQIENVGSLAPRSAVQKWRVATMWKVMITNIVVADEARETRGDYTKYTKGDKTKTSNAAITDAAYQVGLASQSIFFDESRYMEALSRSAQTQAIPWRKHVLLPVIVTTANLFLCRFDIADIDGSTGMVDISKTSLEPVNAVIYEYPLPRHLQSSPTNVAEAYLAGRHEQGMRLSIVVVHSTKLKQVLSEIQRDTQEYFR